MANITKTLVEGEICTIQISVAKYDDSAGTKTYGTTNVNLTGKDIYIDFYADDSATAVLSKDRVGGTSTSGVTLDEDSATKSNLLIALSAADYANFDTNDQNERRYEMRVRYRYTSGGVVTDEKSIYPYINESGQLVRYFINLVKKVQS
jgi:hypothetical protein